MTWDAPRASARGLDISITPSDGLPPRCARRGQAVINRWSVQLVANWDMQRSTAFCPPVRYHSFVRGRYVRDSELYGAEGPPRVRSDRRCPERVISGSADHVDGLPPTRPVYPSKRTRAERAGSAMGQEETFGRYRRPSPAVQGWRLAPKGAPLIGTLNVPGR
jgi:hypothetical protein